MPESVRIFVIIPAYNEASRIGTTLRDLKSVGNFTLVVVDDGSDDGTAAVARGNATVIRHAMNRGMGAALATGTRYALKHGADIILHFDADGQHRATEIPQVIEPIQKGLADIVLGSRYLHKTSSVPFTKKIFIHKPAIYVQNMMTGIRLSDVHNGFRALSRHAASQIIITQDRMAHNTEIVAAIKRLRLRYREVPVTIAYHEYGQGLAGGIRILFDLLKRQLFR